MTNPNSRLTRLRQRLVRWLEPQPYLHEAWCQDCMLNQGRTLVLGVGAIRAHTQSHMRQGTAHLVRLKVKAPVGELPEDIT